MQAIVALAMKRKFSQRCHFPELRDNRCQKAARTIQRAWKLYQIKKRKVQQKALALSYCACTLCYFRDLTKRHRLFVLNRNATLVQAAWRGHITRKNQLKNRDIRLAYRRLVTVHTRATEDMKLGNRLESALSKLHRNRGTHIDGELATIETVTKMSPECCLKAAQKSVVPIMMNILNESNRSEAHKLRVSHSISVLVNVAKFEKCSKYLSDGESVAAMCIKMMNIHKKSDQILIKCATLLAILCRNRLVKDVIRKDTMNKFTIGGILKNHCISDGKTIEIKASRESQIRFVPYWCLKKSELQQFVSKTQALSFLAHLFGQ